jgi:hypothetical protein
MATTPFKMQRVIRAVVKLLDRGEQPPEDSASEIAADVRTQIVHFPRAASEGRLR